jgi:activating signal cointegrator 1
MSTTKTRIDLATAQKVAAKLIKRLGPSCARIEVAGSIRRGKPHVGDVELVCIPHYLEQLDLFGEVRGRTSVLDQTLDGMVRSKACIREVPPGWDTTPAWGARYKKFWLLVRGEDVQVDLFITRPDAWGAIFTIRTGPHDFSTELVTHLKHNTPYRQQDGGLVDERNGEVVPVPEERDYFRLAGLPYIEPEQRTRQRLVQVIEETRTCMGAGVGCTSCVVDCGHATPVDAGPAEPVGDPQVTEVRPPFPRTIKALTIWQPWASLMAAGVKEYETRGWSTGYRGWLAIHAAKRAPEPVPDGVMLVGDEALPGPLPRGAVVCIAQLVDVVPTKTLMAQPGFAASHEKRLGDFSPGRFGWKLEVVHVFDEPVPARGQQGLWDWTLPPGVLMDDIRPGTVVGCARCQVQPRESGRAYCATCARELAQDDGRTTVHNIRDLPDGWQDDSRYVYIGRKNARRGVPESRWANPFVMGHDGSRATVIRLYREYLAEQPDLLHALGELTGKRLVCWCAPHPCHGHILATLADMVAAGRWRAGLELPWLRYTTDTDVRMRLRARLETLAGLRT